MCQLIWLLLMQLLGSNVSSAFFQPDKYFRVTSRRRLLVFASTADLRNRLGLHDRFDRWRFLQYLLDEETTSHDTNRVIYAMLDSYLKVEPDERETVEFTPEKRARLEIFLQESKDETIMALIDLDGTETVNEGILKQLEQFLPDPEEDEDAFKGLWDTVIELHGRESVKIGLQNNMSQWQARCLIARLLIFYDFLSTGLVD